MFVLCISLTCAHYWASPFITFTFHFDTLSKFMKIEGAIQNRSYRIKNPIEITSNQPNKRSIEIDFSILRAKWITYTHTHKSDIEAKFMLRFCDFTFFYDWVQLKRSQIATSNQGNPYGFVVFWYILFVEITDTSEKKSS